MSSIASRIRICSDTYPTESTYNSYFDRFPYILSDFQKYAIEGIIDGHHVLTTAHTGSGKTLSAEFAIQYFTELGKKVVYTSPIKALSNQKYYEFTQKYPHISFGLLTGDIKTNPDAQVLIMTTEILMNYLFQTNTKSAVEHTVALQFQIDIEHELGCVVFDEVHYINDEQRGHVWEQTILMLPRHIQMVMLSATIDRPEKFATWISNRYVDDDKMVYLASTDFRIVPLTHYGYVTTTEALYKSTKDKALQQSLRERMNKLITIRTSDGKYVEDGVKEIVSLTKMMEDKDLYMKRKFVLNNLAKYLKDNEMLPAIGFVFSRKYVEQCARELTHEVLEDDSKVAYIVRRECEQIVRKLPNFQEYLELPEYQELVSFLEKGVGIHHSGMIPILREIVELMISKKYIKILFATESFAIGLDCPIKTAIFIGLKKFDGNTERYVYPHEYTQMAGRAGRRGIDTIGHVIHCNNLFDTPTFTEYKTILCGKPQTLESKFYVSYNVILSILSSRLPSSTPFSDFAEFANKSMWRGEIDSEQSGNRLKMEELRVSLAKKEACKSCLRTTISDCETWLKLELDIKRAVNKKRKEYEREMAKLRAENKYIVEDSKFVQELRDMQHAMCQMQTEMDEISTRILTHVHKVCHILEQRNIVQISNTDVHLTDLGKMATQIAEIHPIISSEQLERWRTMRANELVGIFSCFTNVRVIEDCRRVEPSREHPHIYSAVVAMKNTALSLEQLELTQKMVMEDKEMIFDLTDVMFEWCELINEYECKAFLQTRINQELGISTGDFAKACVKIVTIARELAGICEMVGWIDMKSELTKIDTMVLKYIATAQSLYV